MSVRIWVDEIEIELGSKLISAPTTYQLIDIKNISSRKGSSTKTVTVPSTALNDKVMGVARDINATNQFDKFDQHNIRIEENSEVVFYGLMQITDVTDDSISFFCFAELSKLKNLFGDLTLNDLNLTDLDHVYDATIFETWNGTYPSGVPADYFYPLIDYGRFGLLIPGNNPEVPDIMITDVYPALYLYRAIRQMLLDNGYTLVTSFFDDPQTSKILVPFTNELFLHDDIRTFALYGFWGFTTGAQQFLSVGSYTIEAQEIVYDPLTQWVSNEYISAGNQTVVAELEGGISINAPYDSTLWANVFIEKYTDSIASWSAVKTIPFSGTDNAQVRLFAQDVVTLLLDDRLRFRLEILQETDVNIYVDKITINPDRGGATIEVGEVVQMAPNLPPMKQADLFKACYQMFNWVVAADDVEGVVYIETDDVFYQNNEQVDMSAKMNLNPLPSIQYKSLDFSKNYDLKYKHDTDDYHLTRTDSEQANLGNFKFGDGNLYLSDRGEATLIGEVPFSPTVTAKTFLGANDGTGIDLPSMILNSSPSEKNTAHDPRILINAGLISIEKLSDGAYSELYIEGVGTVTELPACYFQKRLYGDVTVDAFTMNLSFLTPAGPAYTLGNLVDLYYRKPLTALATSAQVTAFFNLTSSDVSNLDYSTLWYVGYYNATFRLNRIIDYLPGRSGATKVELIKVGVPVPIVVYEKFE